MQELQDTTSHMIVTWHILTWYKCLQIKVGTPGGCRDDETGNINILNKRGNRHLLSAYKWFIIIIIKVMNIITLLYINLEQCLTNPDVTL